MTPGTLALSLATLAASIVLTGVVRRLALRRGLLDVPNARSSHVATTPRGGGLAIVLATVATIASLALLGVVRPQLALALIGGGVAVAAVGFADDHRPVVAGGRLAVHLLAAVWAVYWLGGFPALAVGAHTVRIGWLGDLCAVLGVMWVLNLFNFMDGIDGIAASEAVFITGAALVPMQLMGVASEVSAASLIFGAGTLGFLVWNWPPAKIFMGDVGSGYVGYAIATLALASAAARPAAVWVWLILGAVFFVDATVTLVRRLIRGEPAHQAHRTHAYQWLARRWGSHGRVTLAVIAVNLLWLLPCALLAALRPEYALPAVLLAFAPLLAIAVAAGAGRRERDKS